MKLRVLGLSAVFALSVAAVKPAFADTTVYQQTPNQSDAFFADQSQMIFDDFTLSSTATVNSLTWYGGVLSAAPSTFTIDFYSDSGGGIPGALIGSVVTPSNGAVTGKNIAASTGIDAVMSNLPEEVYGASLTPLTFVAGTRYWIEITANTNNSWGWEEANGGNNTFLFTRNGGLLTDHRDGDLAFTLSDVSSASSVPEPSSFALLGTGVLGMAGFARRKFLRS